MNEETKPLTEAELAYFRALNDEARVTYQHHLEAQQRLGTCLAFLREQHDAPDNEWLLRDLQVGFERIPEKPKREGTPQRKRKNKAIAIDDAL